MTNVNRRQYLGALGGMLGAAVATGVSPSALASDLPAAAMFAFPAGTVYLNAARLHPLSVKSVEAVQAFLKVRSLDPVPDTSYFTEIEARVRGLLARLVNAHPDEISYTPGAQAAENLVVSGLGLDQAKDAIVTDALHYRGSLYLYGEMARRGYDVRIVRPRDHRIRLEDIASAIDGKTRLVAVSLVSYVNGFQHDLKALCDVAHAKGALVLADVAQAAGAVPVDVRVSGVDFLAFAGHKWLMGDRGVGALYVKAGLLGTRVRRTRWGYEQMASFADHLFPPDPQMGQPATWTAKDDASGHFEVGTNPDILLAALADPLEFLNAEGVAKIQARRRPLMERLITELPKLGYPCLTPSAESSICSFSVKDKAATNSKLKAKNVVVSMIGDVMRVSPSVYNTDGDIESLLQALRA